MSSKPLLSAAQWRAIAPLLPEKLRRDQTAIEAILFREFSGRSLTEVSETFGRTGLLRLQLTWSALRQETLRPLIADQERLAWQLFYELLKVFRLVNRAPVNRTSAPPS